MASVVSVLSKTPNLLKELTRVLPSVTFHEVQDPEHDTQFKQSAVLVCDFDLVGKYLYDLPNTKWMQGTWAGVDKIMPLFQNKPLPYQITRFTGDHFGRIMGEYVVANIVNHERDLCELRDYQRKKQWHKEGKICDYRVISDLTIGVLGLGNIGSRIGKILNMLGARILALGRRPALPAGDDYSHVSRYHTKETLPSLLKECDYIISVLPSTRETNGLLDNDILKNCSDKKSVLINIGRSNTLSENSLIKAIQNKVQRDNNHTTCIRNESS
ncbi:glyoxylate/hydroxypyruvate reductase A HPR2-like isoform X2 [Tribolium madens]|uniref:glyoxylate/hydroxypyruvate reductase A HPR2-like isoform X2 n=1 Tax=Tribolium madens TaxID=41895 RepID=UPI001CF740CD|nr:glyoxylate/hydroxypyruvate reductase A HPR2-like isoform X2 [Tribolium madens]